MSDQAEGLRRLAREHKLRAAAITHAPRAGSPSLQARSLLLASGKGGVGTSNIALNLALVLGEMGRSVLLIDADLGLANLDLLCGASPRRDLGDVLSGVATLGDALIQGPAGVRLLPGAHAMRIKPGLLADAPARIAAELTTLKASFQFVILDAGSGLNPRVAFLARHVDEVALVLTPEPTAMADTHASIARLRRLPEVRLRVLVNQARSTAEGREILDRVVVSSRAFLGTSVSPLGHVRHDPRVGDAVRSRTPFLIAAPRGVASRSLRRLARVWLAEPFTGVDARGRGASAIRALAGWWTQGVSPPQRKDHALMSP